MQTRDEVIAIFAFISGFDANQANGSLERFSIAFTANGKRQAEVSRLPKTREIYLVSAYICLLATALEQVLKTEK